MLNRRYFIFISAAGITCTRPSKSLKDLLPGQVQRAWTLRQADALPVEEAPAIIRSLGLRQAISAVYEGNGKITVHLFEMNVEASAFELIQKWRQQDGLASYKGPYFFVANPSGPDQATVSSFLRVFQQEMKTG
jgi:hypothetical protein